METLAMFRLGVPPKLCVSPSEGPRPERPRSCRSPARPQKLQIDFICHAQACRTDRMAEAFQAAVDLAGYRAIPIIAAVAYVVGCTTFVRQSQIFHQHKLGDRKAIVHFDQVDGASRIFDARLGVGPRPRRSESSVCGFPFHEAWPISTPLLGASCRALTETRSRRPRLRAIFGRCHDGAGRAVADTAAVEHAERIGDGGRIENLLFGDPVAQMRLRIACGILVALYGYVRHGALQFVHRVFVALGVGTGQLCERARCGARRQIQVFEGSLGPFRKAR